MKKTLKFSDVDQNYFFTTFNNIYDLNADHLTLEFNTPLTEENTLRIYNFIYGMFNYLRFGQKDNYTLVFWK